MWYIFHCMSTEVDLHPSYLMVETDSVSEILCLYMYVSNIPQKMAIVQHSIRIISELGYDLLMHILILRLMHHPCLISSAKQCLNSIQRG
jgi:hypothetical protein